MAVRIFQKWIDLWRNRRKSQDVEKKPEAKNIISNNLFSPLTYQNPYITHIHAIIEHVIRQKKISYQNLKLVIIDAEEICDQDDEDIQMTLYELEHQLNYLLLITDRPERYRAFIDEMYEENGLIVQQISKSERRRAHGNLILDFERNGGILGENEVKTESIYLPIYKRPWEISENLDILVPVGYNTLVVDGIFPLYSEESCFMSERFMKDKMIDRLDREFRKG